MAYTIVYVIFFLYLCGVFEKRVAMKLRKIGIMVLGCVLLMGMAACSKDKEEVTPDGSTPAQVDPRDAFVGDYTYEATGFMHINDLPLPLFDFSAPRSTLTFRVTKPSLPASTFFSVQTTLPPPGSPLTALVVAPLALPLSLHSTYCTFASSVSTIVTVAASVL